MPGESFGTLGAFIAFTILSIVSPVRSSISFTRKTCVKTFFDSLIFINVRTHLDGLLLVTTIAQKSKIALV
jgi:hypothetical protein